MESEIKTLRDPSSLNTSQSIFFEILSNAKQGTPKESQNYFSILLLGILTCCNNDNQVKCFDAPLQPAEIVGVRRVVQEKKKEGVNDLGLTLDGFLFLHSLFIDKGRLETTWAVLRKFGYGIDLKLRDDFLPAPLKHAPDQVCVLIYIIELLVWCWILLILVEFVLSSCRV